MSNLVDWGSVDAKKGGGLFLRLKSPGNYQIRLVHKPLPVWRYYVEVNGERRSCVASNDPDGPVNCPVNAKYGEKSKERYAIYVLNRLDENKIMILEAPAGVFRKFRDFFDNEGIEPGGKEAPDFKIKVEGSGLLTRYTVTYTQKNFTFTEEEALVITDKLKNHKLAEVESLVAVDPSKIEEVLYGDRSESGKPDAEEKQEKPQGKPVASGKKAEGDSIDW